MTTDQSAITEPAHREEKEGEKHEKSRSSNLNLVSHKGQTNVESKDRKRGKNQWHSSIKGSCTGIILKDTP